MSKFQRFTRFERPQMVDPGEIEEVWVNADLTDTVTPVSAIPGRPHQTIIHMVNGDSMIVIGTARQVVLTLSGHFDE